MIRLTELRKDRDLSQQQLSSILRIAQNTLSQYETGKREPDNKTLILMSDYFGVTTDYLLGKTDEKTPATTDSDELQEYLEELKIRPDLRMLFSVSKNATKEDVMRTVAIIEALKKEEEGQ